MAKQKLTGELTYARVDRKIKEGGGRRREGEGRGFSEWTLNCVRKKEAVAESWEYRRGN